MASGRDATSPAPRRTSKGPQPEFMPTPVEILERAAQIRATWSAATRRERAGALLPTRWTPPEVPGLGFVGDEYP